MKALQQGSVVSNTKKLDLNDECGRSATALQEAILGWGGVNEEQAPESRSGVLKPRLVKSGNHMKVEADGMINPPREEEKTKILGSLSWWP